jgi:hypothetical protein
LCESSIPQRLSPAGVRLAFNSPFCFFTSAMGKLQWSCGTQLRSSIGVRNSRSKELHDVRDSERAPAITLRVLPMPLERAEQRRVGRIRVGAWLSEASLRTTPRSASSARNPTGARSKACLSFAYFSLTKQRKVRPPPGRTPACSTTKDI